MARTRFGIVGPADDLPAFYASWERWAAEVAETHRSYPVLLRFRSPTANSSWLVGLLAVLDSAALYLAVAPSRAPIEARMCLRMGYSCLRALAHTIGLHVDDDPHAVPALWSGPRRIPQRPIRPARPDLKGVDCRDALAHLHRLNLVRVDPSSGPRAIRTHALVQRAALEHQPPEVISAVVTAADALVQVWPEVERDTELGRVLRDNTARLTDRDPHLLWEPDGHPVLGRAGRSLGKCGLVRAAVAYGEDMAVKASDVLGPDHSDTLTTRSNITHWREQTHHDLPKV